MTMTISEALGIFELGDDVCAGKPMSSPSKMKELDNPTVIRNIIDMKEAIDHEYIDYDMGRELLEDGMTGYSFCELSDERFVRLGIIGKWYDSFLQLSQLIQGGISISDIRNSTLGMVIHLSDKPCVREYIATYLTSESRSRILYDLLTIANKVESASDEVPFSDEYMEKFIYYRKHIQHEHDHKSKTYMQDYKQFQSSMSGLLDTLLHIDHCHVHDMNAYHIRFWMLSTVVDEAMPALNALVSDDDYHPEDITVDDIRTMKLIFDTMNREHGFSNHLVHDMRNDTELVSKVNIGSWIQSFISAYMRRAISANMMHCAFKCAEMSAFTREDMSLSDCLHASPASIRIMMIFRAPLDIDDEILLHAITMPLDFAVEEAKVSILS